jgi:hypothetical protein
MPHDKTWRISREGLFTEVRGRGILRSSDAGSCINRPPGAAERGSKGLHTACEGLRLVAVHEDAVRCLGPVEAFRALARALPALISSMLRSPSPPKVPPFPLSSAHQADSARPGLGLLPHKKPRGRPPRSSWYGPKAQRSRCYHPQWPTSSSGKTSASTISSAKPSFSCSSSGCSSAAGQCKIMRTLLWLIASLSLAAST